MKPKPKAYQGALADLRSSLFEAQSMLIMLAMTLWIITANTIAAPLSTLELALMVAVVGLCGFGFWLRGHYFQLAVIVTIGGLWLLSNAAIASLRQPGLLFSFPVIVIAAALVWPRRIAFLVAALSTIAVIAQGIWAAWLPSLVIPMVCTVWFAWGLSAILTTKFYEALANALNYQNYALLEMRKAREHRAELFQLSKLLNQARQELEHANGQLGNALEAAEEARNLKALFAANVSHELRTPINLIVGFTEMIVKAPHTYAEPLPAAYWSDLYIVFKSAEHLQNLINDVLDISQLNAGQMAVVKEAVNSRDLIVETTEMMRELIARKNLRLYVELPAEMPTIYVDRVRIRQVLLNLLSNALRFTEHGSLTVQAEVGAAHLAIHVRDTGIGIPPDRLEEAFAEFHQLDNTLSKRYGGTGLGLALSRRFVELHGGHIAVSSDGIDGHGSQFTVQLPLAGGARLFDYDAFDSAPAAKNGERYFVVYSHDQAVLQLFKRHTTKHNALGVQRLDDLLHIVTTVHPTLVLVDEADDVATIFDQLAGVDPQLPILECAMPSGSYATQTYGVADYLVKPVTYTTLYRAMQNLAIEGRQALIIDDDPDLARMFGQMLRAMPEHFEVLQAYGSVEGLAMIQNYKPDVILLDIVMPEADGLTVLRQIKANPVLARIPVIIISARGPLDALVPPTRGHLTLTQPTGFGIMELVQCVEAIVGVLTPHTDAASRQTALGRASS